jgi:phosphoglycolate phosphatase-like HAD superfamily hydrolase
MGATIMKPRVFIGSSKEQLALAQAVQSNIEHETEPTVWRQGVFELSRPAIESLLRALDNSDFGIFVLAPDDLAMVRNERQLVVRDNVILELGMFIGGLGIERTFFIVPRNSEELHIPSDIFGLTPGTFDLDRVDHNMKAALGPACGDILAAIMRMPVVKRTARSQVAPSSATNIVTVTEAEDTRTGLLNFLQSTSLKTVTQIAVSAYTGSSTIRTICSFLEGEEHPNRQIPLKVLLRSRFLTDKKRAEDTKSTILKVRELPNTVPWIVPEMQFYAAPPVLRSVVVDHFDRTRTAYLSYYDWQRPSLELRRPTANERASFVTGSIGSSLLLPVHWSWFQHYWAKKTIHTLIFDFDDTLFYTTEIRTRAWVQAIQEFVDDGSIVMSDLSRKIRTAYQEHCLEAAVLDVYLKEQEEANMIFRLFSRRINPIKRNALVERRLTIRQEKTLDAEPISDVVGALEQLRKDYQLVIVTATNESLVQSVLDKNRINYFSFIFGREAPTQQWSDIETKSQNLLRVANLLGVPLDRIVFIGDANSDYRSARQLGMKFIENRANASRYNRSTLIHGDLPKDHRYITCDHGTDELPDMLTDIDSILDWRQT